MNKLTTNLDRQTIFTNISLFNKEELNKKRNICLKSLFICTNKQKLIFYFDY
jgi:hypothetical protein